MASYTNSLRLTLPVTGTDDGTWGDTVNNGITTLIDTSIAGTAAITMTAADYTLTNNSGATDEARSMFITLGGTPGASFNVICPTKSKLYFVKNNTAFAQTVKTSAGTGISVPSSGDIMVLYCDGTNVVNAITSFTSLNLVTPVLVTPVLGTPTSGTLSNCTADGTNAVGYRNIPAIADKVTSYSLLTTDVGKVVGVGTGGSITVPDATFASGDAVLIFNNTASDVTLTMTITNAYIAGVNVDAATITLATRGVANILFVSGTTCVVTGNVS